MLYKAAFHTWKTFISPLLVQIDHYVYLRNQGEIVGDEVKYFESTIKNELQDTFIDLLQIFLKIVVSNEYEQDIVWISLMTLELSKQLEQKNRFRESVQTLRSAHDKIINYRDEKLQRRLQADLELLLPFSITCNNEKIDSFIHKI